MVTLISFHPGVCIVWFDTLAVDWPHIERACNGRRADLKGKLELAGSETVREGEAAGRLQQR